MTVGSITYCVCHKNLRHTLLRFSADKPQPEHIIPKIGIRFNNCLVVLVVTDLVKGK